MTTHTCTLTVDFGSVGYMGSKHPFRVKLDSSKLTELIRAAQQAHRAYELLLINRPGDVWDYVSVHLDDVPVRVSSGIKHQRDNLKSRYDNTYPWEADCVPFSVFDRMFYWAWDDTEPEDAAWLNHRDSPAMRNYALQLLEVARAAQGKLDWNDHLLRHITSMVKTGVHPYSFLAREVAIAKSHAGKPTDPVHTDDFYKKLSELLRDPALVSIAYRAGGDYEVLRMFATEQRRRANLTGHTPGHAMHISALVNHKTDNVAWDSEIWFFDEGLGHGDLFVQGAGLGGAPIKALVESHHRNAPGLYILSIRDEGEIADFEKESGDGWFLYKRQHPVDRRMGLEYIEPRRSSKLGPVLQFAETGKTIFDYDKTVLFVGGEVSHQARSKLAAVISEWEANGGDPVLVVLGDQSPFLGLGCRKIFTPQDDGVSAETNARWLSDLLRSERPWIDVLIALEIPSWAELVLSRIVKSNDSPWQSWVVSSREVKEFADAFVIGGVLESEIHTAHRRAIASRPVLL